MLLALPTLISNIPFVLGIPLISTAQPTRLIYPATFSLAILAAFGATYIANLSKLKPKHLIPILVILSTITVLWIVTFIKPLSFFGSEINAEIAFRNLAFPTIFILLGSILVILMATVKNDKARFLISLLILLAVSFEMIRFAQKFTPFTTQSYLYPQTKTISFLKSQKGTFRIASLDRRILPPNFATHYKLQTIEGYDPLYLESYARFITTLENNNDVDKLKNFNRIITVDKYDSQLFDFLNVRYILSLNNIDSPKLRKIFEEGQTKVYENNNSFDRAYFVENVVSGGNLNEIDISRAALVEGKEFSKTRKFTIGTANIIFYSENRVDISTINEGEGFLVVSDTNYPTWKAFLDGKEIKIYNANIAFRGVVIPPGKHMLSFQNSKLGL